MDLFEDKVQQNIMKTTHLGNFISQNMSIYRSMIVIHGFDQIYTFYNIRYQLYFPIDIFLPPKM